MPVVGRTELVVPGDGSAGSSARSSPNSARHSVEVSGRAGTGLDEHVLVVVAHLVAEVAEHRPVRLAEPHPQ